jgi:hypothetical protein
MKERAFKYFKLLLISGLLISISVVGGTLVSMYKSVSNTCTNAKAEYNSDCVEAMIAILDSKNETFVDRNHAIWVLGQLADDRALPKLKEYYKGVPDEVEPLNKTLSQYELQKAIKWCEEGNVTSWMYRNVK